MADLPRAREVIAAVCQATDLPVSVKIRARSGSVTALDFLKNIAGLPVAAVMIHGRSLRQGFAGEIDYALIKEARHYFSGIILANGGINDLVQAKKTLALTEADGLGLARGALGRPWLFTEIKQDQELDLTAADMAEVIRRQAKLFRQIKGDEAFPELRKHLCWYVQGIPGASHYRAQLVKVASYQDLDNILNELKTNI
jgi:tRNA-dihydrouridine synthase